MHDNYYQQIERAEKSYRRSVKLGCAFQVILVLLGTVLGGVSVDYLLLTFVGKTIPFLWAMVVGLFTSPFSIPAAVTVWVLRNFGIL